MRFPLDATIEEQFLEGGKTLTHLYLIRHGDFTIDLKDGKHLDLGLMPLGVSQAERLRDRLATTGEISADVLIASTLPRARQTAEILAPALGLRVVLDEAVEEWRNEDGSLSPNEFMERVMRTPGDASARLPQRLAARTL